MHLRSIRSRLLAALLGTALILIVAGTSFTYALVRERLLSDFDHFLEDKLRYHQISAMQVGQRISFRISQPVWERIHDPADPEFFQFRFTDGRDVYRSYGLGDEGEGLPRVGLAKDALIGIDCELPDGRPGRCMGLVFVPDQGEGEYEAEPVELHLVVAHDREDVDATLSRLRWLLLVSGSLAVMLMSAATLWIVRRALQPLRALSDQIETMPIGGAGERFALQDVPEEVAPVIDRLNELLVRAEGAIEHERQFTSNAAHELRNPLAALRSQLELALGDARDPDADETTLARSLAIQRQMQGLVDNLLALARLDAGNEQLERGAIEPVPVLRRCWKPFFEIAAERSLKVRWDLKRAPATFPTAPALFEILASNLFDNATSYAPEGGEIEIIAESRGDGLRLVVANSNPGITEGEVESLFQRFGRGDASTAGARNHAGIGLSLCDKVVATLQGQLQVNVDSDRFAVEVEIPSMLG